jgi:hypothetical protein
VKLELRPHLRTLRRQVEQSKVLSDWKASGAGNMPGTVTVNDIDEWGGEIHSLHVTIHRKGDPWPVRSTLRSPTVDVLTFLTDGRQRHVALVNQYRPAVGMYVLSNVAGGIDWDDSHYSAGRREVREELGLTEGTEIRMVMLAPRPVLATPGITNERVYMMGAEIVIAPANYAKAIERLNGRRTGLEAEGERLVVRIVPAAQARQTILAEHYPDAKTLLSLGLAGL